MIRPDSARAAAELTRRRNDGLAMLRLLPGEQERVARSVASELLILGGNRGGKTLSAAAKFAAVARDKPMHLHDGTPVDQRLPHQKGRKLLMWIVGLQWDHIGDTIWRVLFEPGLYKIIRDRETMQWRAFDPVKDAGRESEQKDSFPLIPLSEVKGGYNAIGWENKKEKQFNRIELNNGTVIRCWASTGTVKAGDPVDYIWIDEEIAIVGHYPEWQMRLPNVKGRIVWSSLSYANPALINLSRRAHEQKIELERGQRQTLNVEQCHLTFSSNPFIDDEEKQKVREGLSEEELLMRDQGQFQYGTLKIYPNFSPNVHRAIYVNPEEDDVISRILRERNGQPPASWTREVILDPGTNRPFVMFGAIPPPTMTIDGQEVSLWMNDEPYYIVYDEIGINRLNAQQIASRVAAKMKGYVAQRFIIDGQASRQTPMGFAGTIGQNYSAEFLKLNLSCVASGSSFIEGDPDFSARSLLVQAAMTLRPCGTPRLRIVIDQCPTLVYQLENNIKAVERAATGETLVLDKPAKQKDDGRVCLEYWLSRNPQYVEPPVVEHVLGGPGMKAYQAIQRMFGKKPVNNTIHCGPGEAA